MTLRHLRNLFGDKIHTLPLVVLYLTDGCNSRCSTCDIWRSPRRNMSLALIEQIAAEVESLQVRWVLLSGGEAMQHPHWPQAAQRLRAAGVHVMLLTNGLLLRRQIDDVQASVDEVIVSLDAGTAATYEAVRGVAAFDLVLEGIRAVRAAGLPVTTRTTVQKANYHEIPLIIEAARSADVSAISFLTVDTSSEIAFGPRFVADTAMPVMSLGAAPPPRQMPSAMLDRAEIDHLAQILDDIEIRFADDFASGRIAESPAKLRRMLPYFRALLGDDVFPAPRCNAPHFSTVIEVDGTLRPCYFLPAYGRLRQDSALSVALNSETALALRAAYRSGHRAECARCVCPLYKGPRSLLRM